MPASNYFPKWYYPTSVEQYSEDDSHIPWDSAGNFVYIKSRDLSKTKTVLPLKHIPTSPGIAIRNKTWFLLCKFSMGKEIGSVNGLRLQVQMDRGARITDETIQLTKNGQLIGDNLASSGQDQLKIYGDKWGLDWETLNIYDLTNNSVFGVLLRFQSHPSIPHSTTPAIDYVRIRYTIDNELPYDRQELRPNIGWTMWLAPFDYDGGTLKPGDGTTRPKQGSGGSPGSPNPGDPYVGSQGDDGYRGSFGYRGSGYTGSGGFDSGYSGSTAGYIGSGAYSLPTQQTTVQTYSQLPLQTQPFQGWFVVDESAIYYYNGSQWILAARV